MKNKSRILKSKGLRIAELFSLSLRTFKTKPQRAFLTIMGMSIGIATVLVLVSLGYGLQYILIGKLMTTEDSLVSMEISYPSESGLVIKKPVIESLKSYEDVSEVSPIAEFQGEISQGNNAGVLIDTRIVNSSYFRLAGILPDIGTVPTKDNGGVVLSSQALIPLGLSPSDSALLDKTVNLKVFYQNEQDGTFSETSPVQSTSIRGIIGDESMTPTAIIFSNALTQEPPFYGKALVKAKNVDVLERLRDKLLSDGFLVSARIDLVTQARKITNIITIILGIFGITALIVSAIGMFNTMLVGFLERVYEVGILKSLGAMNKDIRNLFLVEAAIMGAMGGLGGTIVGVGGGQILNLVISTISTSFGGNSIELFMIPWWFIFLAVGLSVGIGFISGWWPARRAVKLSPKEAFTKR